MRVTRLLVIVITAGVVATAGGGTVGLATQPAATAPQPASPDRLEAAYRLNNLGVSQLEQYDYDAASASFTKALDLVPTLQLARINLAIALLHAGKLPEAEQAAGQAREADPTSPQASYVIGLAARGQNRPDVAAAAFEQVLRIDPNDLGARVNLGQLYMQQQRYDEAAALFKAALDSEPYNATAAYNLGTALTRGEHAEEADAAMKRFQALRASGYATTFSNNYLERGRYAEAVTATGAEADLVDRATPAVTFVTQEIAATPSASAAAPERGAVTLADIDRDGDLDLVAAGPQGTTLYINRVRSKAEPGISRPEPSRGREPAGTMAAGGNGPHFQRAAQQPPWPAGGSHAIVVADYDNDLQPDVAIAADTGIALLRQESAGVFKDVTASAGVSGAGSAQSLAFVDVDHDGDADILAAGLARGDGPDAQSSVRLFRNNGNGTFADATAAAALESAAREIAIVPTDFDNRRDVDLLFLANDATPRLMRNLRDGRFAAVTGTGALDAPPGDTAVAAGDVNKDGFTDFLVASASGGRLALGNAGRGFVAGPAFPAAAGAAAVLTLDYDNDGLLDIVAVLTGGIRLWRNLGTENPAEAGSTRSQWIDMTDRAVPEALRPGAARPDALDAAAAGDVDRDGDTDLVVRARSGRLWLVRNDGGNARPSLSVSLTGRVSNRSAVGASVEMRAGSLWQKLEVTAASPAPAATGLVFGLGRRTEADVVRVLWPSGVLQAESVTTAADRAASIDLTELDRKPSSCPFLYTWNGTRFEFVTDFMGGGEMGYLHAPGVRSVPDPDEYVRIPGDRLVPRDGRLELRVTNELEETTFVDRLQLVAVTHPSDVVVFPAEGLKSAPQTSFGLYVAPALRPPARAHDDRGTDVADRLARLDRRYVDGFDLEPVRGYARPHALVLDLADAATARPGGTDNGGRVLLVLTGWTDYAFSSDNLAAYQAGLSLTAPSLQVKDAAGRWQTVIEEIGIPVGRPQSVVVDLTGKFPSASREVRIVTTMRIYWDQALVDTSGRARWITESGGHDGAWPSIDHAETWPSIGPITMTRLDATTADLRWRGFSAEVALDGRQPLSYDYARVTAITPWKLMPGRYTREGDVGELLDEVDDMFVVSRPGDEIALSFDATRLPPMRPGLARTYLLFAHGYSKEMDLSSASPDQVAPLPFAAMSGYPYRWPEQYPDTPAHRAYQQRYNTRVVGRALPMLDAAATVEATSNRRRSERSGGAVR